MNENCQDESVVYKIWCQNYEEIGVDNDIICKEKGHQKMWSAPEFACHFIHFKGYMYKLYIRERYVLHFVVVLSRNAKQIVEAPEPGSFQDAFSQGYWQRFT